MPSYLICKEIRDKMRECLKKKMSEMKKASDAGTERDDCADFAYTVLIRCAAELRYPLNLRAGGKGYDQRDYKDQASCEKTIREPLGSITIPDHTRPQGWKDLAAGDVLWFDLRHQLDAAYSAASRSFRCAIRAW